VVDRLEEVLGGEVSIRGVNVGESESVSGSFVRLRDELHWKVRTYFEARDCKMPDDKALLSELVATKYGTTSAGKIKVESKDDLKKRLRRSPDLFDALMLTFASDDRQRQEKDRHRRTPQRSGSPWAA